MKKSSRLIVAIAALALSASAMAESFQVATGDLKGGSTYVRMFTELSNRCGKELHLEQVGSTGSVKNVELLVSNAVNGAFVQSDLLAFRRMTDPASVENVRTVVALHPEQLHFVARGDVKVEGGFMGIGGKEVKYNTLNDLAGRPVGAVGGSVLSGRVVASKSGLKFNVVEFPNNETLQKALLEGKVDSILVVGGAPHALVGSLDRRFKLLSVPAETQKALGQIYAPAKVSYGNLNQAGVDTISTEALFVTRTYRSPEMQQNLAKLRSCFERQLPIIQDARGTHAAWQNVDANNKGKWTYYDLPAVK